MPGLRRLRHPRRRAGLHAGARHPARADRLRLRHRLRGPLPVLHADLRDALDPRPCAGDRDRVSPRRVPTCPSGSSAATATMLSIGGNHLIHALRRNVNLKLLLFNNQVYGLTKGQYSPTSPRGQRSGSTPMGSIDEPFNPLGVAIGAEATFVARAIDTDRKHVDRGAAARGRASRRRLRRDPPELQHLQRRRLRRGARATRPTGSISQHGEPVRFGAEGERGVVARGPTARWRSSTSPRSGEDALLVHDEHHPQPSLAFALSRLMLQTSRRRPGRRVPRRRAAGLRRPDGRADRRRRSSSGARATSPRSCTGNDTWTIE